MSETQTPGFIRRLLGPPKRDLIERIEGYEDKIDVIRADYDAKTHRVVKRYEGLIAEQTAMGKRMYGEASNFIRSLEAFVSDPATFRDASVMAQTVSDIDVRSLAWADFDPAKLKAKVKKTPDGDKIPEDCTNPLVLDFLANPDPDRDMGDLIYETTLHLQADGKSFAMALFTDAPKRSEFIIQRGNQKEYDKAAHLEALKEYLRTKPTPGTFAGQVTLMLPSEVKAARLEGSGKRLTHFELTAASGWGSKSQGWKIHPERMVYIRMPHMIGVLDGLGWMEVAIDDLVADKKLEKWQADWLKKGGLFAIIESPEDLTKEQILDLITQHAARLQSEDPEAVGVFGNNAKYRELGLNPKTAMVTEQRGYHQAQRQIASGTPPIFRADLDTTHYNNQEGQQEVYYNVDVGPMSRRIWKAYTRQLGPLFEVAGLFFIPALDSNRFFDEAFADRDVAERDSLARVQDLVATGALDKESACANLRIAHGYSERESAAMLDCIVVRLPLADRQAVGQITAEVALGNRSRGNAIALLSLYGFNQDEAEVLLADHGDGFTVTPAAPSFFSASQEPPQLYSQASKNTYTCNDRPHLHGSMPTDDEIWASVRGLKDPTGLAKVRKQTLGDLARLEAVDLERWEGAALGYLNRFLAALAGAINRSSGQVSQVEIDRILARVRNEIGDDLFQSLSNLSVSALEQSGAIAANAVGATQFNLQEAARLAHLSSFRERSELINDTSVDAARRWMLRLQSEGATFGEIARTVEGFMTDTNPGRARLITNVELGGAVRSGAQTGFEFAGVAEKQWVSFNNPPKLRVAHRSPPDGPDGTIIGIREKWTLTNPDTGETVQLMHPIDLINGAGHLWAIANCACRSMPVL
jgi:hypothetical protein